MRQLPFELQLLIVEHLDVLDICHLQLVRALASLKVLSLKSNSTDMSQIS